MNILYELAVITQNGKQTSMDVKTYNSREEAVNIRKTLVAGFQRNGFILTEGTDLVERITLRLNADQHLATFGLLVPPKPAPTVQLIIKIRGVI
jgi:hypothetical protein